MPPTSSSTHSRISSKHWEEQYTALKAHYKRHGHSHIPYSFYNDLSEWAVQQRYGRRCQAPWMTPDRIARLDKLDFYWGAQVIKRTNKRDRQQQQDQTWMQRFRQLQSFQRVNGHCNVDSIHNTNTNNNNKHNHKELTEWVKEQIANAKRNDISPVRKLLLENLGLDWEWETNSTGTTPGDSNERTGKHLHEPKEWQCAPGDNLPKQKIIGSQAKAEKGLLDSSLYPIRIEDLKDVEELKLIPKRVSSSEEVADSSSDEDDSSQSSIEVVDIDKPQTKPKRRPYSEISKEDGGNHDLRKPLKKRLCTGFHHSNKHARGNMKDASDAKATTTTSSSSSSSQTFTERYPVGTKVMNYFAEHGWFSGKIVSVKKDSYFVQYDDGDEESYLPEESEDLDQIVANVEILRHPVGTRIQKYMDGWGWCEGELSSMTQSSYCIQYHEPQLKDELLSFDRLDELDRMVADAQNLKHSVGTPVQTFMEDHGWQSGEIAALEKDRYFVEYKNGVQEDFSFHQLEELDRLVENAQQLHPTIRHSMGTQVKQYFRGSGWISGEIVSIRHDRYIIQYQNGREEEFLFFDGDNMQELDEMVDNVKALQDILKYDVGTCVVKFVEGRGGWCLGNVVSIQQDRYVVAYYDDKECEKGEREHFLFHEVHKLDELVAKAKAMQKIFKHKVGTRVKKFFEGYGWFTGEIVSIAKDRYKVLYRDGDSEEYLFTEELDDLEEIVVNARLRNLTEKLD